MTQRRISRNCRNRSVTQELQQLVITPRSALVFGLTTVEINHDLESCTLRPVQRLTKHIIRTLYVRIAIDWNDAPVPYRNAHVVETSAGDLVEVVLGNPRV